MAHLRSALREFNFRRLFIEELNWDNFRETQSVEVGEQSFQLDGAAQKRGLAVFICQPGPDGMIPDRNTRIKIERKVAKLHFEHLIVFVDAAHTTQRWQWVKRERGKPAVPREQIFHPDIKEEAILQKLNNLEIPLDAEELLTLPDVQQQVSSTFDANAERVTKKFYEKYQKEHETFRDFIKGITEEGDRQWYASLMLNRLMFVYFIQKKDFLDGDDNYLSNRLTRLVAERGKDQFHSFYRAFLLRLFHDGLATPEAARSAEINELIGEIPYLNGGIFDLHELERSYSDIQIPDDAFTRLFAFFNTYSWHLDDRPLQSDREINPDVLGYIFEKYVNQKQMGAYYTKEDITEYIGKNTIVPYLFDAAKKECAIAFQPGSALWRLLQDEPDRYIYDAVKKGVDLPLPPDISAGIESIPQRGGWNRPADEQYALPTEIWREHIARRRRYEETWTKLVNGEVTEINDLITLNLDIRQFAQDVIQACEGPELLRAFYQAITKITVLDPTCGSGAFLFAALNILQPLYDACLDRMEGFIEDADDGTHPAKYQDLRAILTEVDRHPNRRYFILKSIILNNLYGVDIMEEATEICKLRLFLKLVSTVESGGAIEALPDIDFNIRAGNTLVGYATYDEVKQAIEGGLQRTFDFDGRMSHFDKQVQLADQAFQQFRSSQIEQSGNAQSVHASKEQLRVRLDALRTELDRYLAGEFAVIKEPLRFSQWKATHLPFHWFIEFFRITQEGGFDVIIGNPPYVSKSRLDYKLQSSTASSFPDIYADIVVRSLKLISRPTGRVGMIIPLSVTFSGDYAELRDVIQRTGHTWISSFDIIPAALFSGASQRCTIAIVKADNKPQMFGTRMYRWRSIFRPSLFQVLGYLSISATDTTEYGIPKHGFTLSISIMNRLKLNAGSAMGAQARFGNNHSEAELRFSKVARNFVSAFLDNPPCLNAQTLKPIISNQAGVIAVKNSQIASASMAALVGDSYLWYWLVRGDGFHVTNWILREYLNVIEMAEVHQLVLLDELGQLMRERRNEALVFKHQSAQYVGNYNYRAMPQLTRRADLLFLSILGLSQVEALDLFDYMQRVLSINTAAGERAIPERVKAMFPVRSADASSQERFFSRVDQYLIDTMGFTPEELAFVVDRENLMVSILSEDS